VGYIIRCQETVKRRLRRRHRLRCTNRPRKRGRRRAGRAAGEGDDSLGLAAARAAGRGCVSYDRLFVSRSPRRRAQWERLPRQPEPRLPRRDDGCHVEAGVGELLPAPSSSSSGLATSSSTPTPRRAAPSSTAPSRSGNLGQDREEGPREARDGARAALSGRRSRSSSRSSSGFVAVDASVARLLHSPASTRSSTRAYFFLMGLLALPRGAVRRGMPPADRHRRRGPRRPSPRDPRRGPPVVRAGPGPGSRLTSPPMPRDPRRVARREGLLRGSASIASRAEGRPD